LLRWLRSWRIGRQIVVVAVECTSPCLSWGREGLWMSLSP
jgi:hypothetical protein